MAFLSILAPTTGGCVIGLIGISSSTISASILSSSSWIIPLSVLAAFFPIALVPFFFLLCFFALTPAFPSADSEFPTAELKSVNYVVAVDA